MAEETSGETTSFYLHCLARTRLNAISVMNGCRLSGRKPVYHNHLQMGGLEMLNGHFPESVRVNLLKIHFNRFYGSVGHSEKTEAKANVDTSTLAWSCEHPSLHL